MSGKPKILIVEDQKSMHMLFTSALQDAFPGAGIDIVEHLLDARNKLQSQVYDAIITDCGFPSDGFETRAPKNRNGILLIEEIRRGDYGKYHAIVPVAFNSAELHPDKIEGASLSGGNTRCFRKGSLYAGLNVGPVQGNFTLESVTGETVRWLRDELNNEKISQRKKEAASVKKKVAGNWIVDWFKNDTKNKQRY